tara:strand:- start:2463 stop:2936 length:474 start_codon:yes stop_codon:yes gene_type:complete
MRHIFTISILVLLLSSSLKAQIITPNKLSYKVSKKNPKQGEIIDLIFTVKLEDTWHLYSNKQNYELGPLPASFEFEPNNSYRLIGDVIPVGVKKEYDKVFEVDVNYFEGIGEFRQQVKLLSENVTIKVFFEYQVCTTIDGKCILGDDEFVFNIKTTK